MNVTILSAWFPLYSSLSTASLPPRHYPCLHCYCHHSVCVHLLVSLSRKSMPEGGGCIPAFTLSHMPVSSGVSSRHAEPNGKKRHKSHKGTRTSKRFRVNIFIFSLVATRKRVHLFPQALCSSLGYKHNKYAACTRYLCCRSPLWCSARRPFRSFAACYDCDSCCVYCAPPRCQGTCFTSSLLLIFF